MASDPGGGRVVAEATTHARLPQDAARDHHNLVPSCHESQSTYHPAVAEPRPIPVAEPRQTPAAMARIPSDVHPPRSRVGELHRRRSQTLYPGGAESPSRGTGVQKPTSRPLEQPSTSLRKRGSAADLYRPGAAAAATRQRMYQMLEAAASAENLAASPTSPTRVTVDDKQQRIHTTTARPIAIPRSRRPGADVDMLDASMPPPPAPATKSNDVATIISSSLPIEARDDASAAGPSSSNGIGNGNSGGLKRSASNSSQTVTIYECPTLEVDEQCGNDEDLSWLGEDQELEQMLAMTSSHRRAGGAAAAAAARSNLAFKRSSEAAMQCSQVVRNVPRMRKRRDRKLDRRRLSTYSESTICLSSSPSPTPTPVG